eukprot:UN24744
MLHELGKSCRDFTQDDCESHGWSYNEGDDYDLRANRLCCICGGGNRYNPVNNDDDGSAVIEITPDSMKKLTSLQILLIVYLGVVPLSLVFTQCCYCCCRSKMVTIDFEGGNLADWGVGCQFDHRPWTVNKIVEGKAFYSKGVEPGWKIISVDGHKIT